MLFLQFRACSDEPMWVGVFLSQWHPTWEGVFLSFLGLFVCFDFRDFCWRQGDLLLSFVPFLSCQTWYWNSESPAQQQSGICPRDELDWVLLEQLFSGNVLCSPSNQNINFYGYMVVFQLRDMFNFEETGTWVRWSHWVGFALGPSHECSNTHLSSTAATHTTAVEGPFRSFPTFMATNSLPIYVHKFFLCSFKTN